MVKKLECSKTTRYLGRMFWEWLSVWQVSYVCKNRSSNDWIEEQTLGLCSAAELGHFHFLVGIFVYYYHYYILFFVYCFCTLDCEYYRYFLFRKKGDCCSILAKLKVISGLGNREKFKRVNKLQSYTHQYTSMYMCLYI